jgi:hypothetical protein
MNSRRDRQFPDWRNINMGDSSIRLGTPSPPYSFFIQTCCWKLPKEGGWISNQTWNSLNLNRLKTGGLDMFVLYWICPVKLDLTLWTSISGVKTMSLGPDKITTSKQDTIEHINTIKRWVTYDLCITWNYCIPSNPRRQSTWPIRFLRGRSTCRCITSLALHELWTKFWNVTLLKIKLLSPTSI